LAAESVYFGTGALASHAPVLKPLWGEAASAVVTELGRAGLWWQSRAGRDCWGD
jgi:hypothetical protein